MSKPLYLVGALAKVVGGPSGHHLCMGRPRSQSGKRQAFRVKLHPHHQILTMLLVRDFFQFSRVRLSTFYSDVFFWGVGCVTAPNQFVYPRFQVY